MGSFLQLEKYIYTIKKENHTRQLHDKIDTNDLRQKKFKCNKMDNAEEEL